MRLKGRVAMVTGGGSGIGRGIALCMAREGADVVIPDVNVAGAKAVAREIQDMGRRAVALKTDVTSEKSVGGMVAKTLKAFGRIDILVNNAGIQAPPGMPFTRNAAADWDQVYAVNVKGIFIVTKAVAESMIKHQYGKIVNIASIAGQLPSPTSPPYSVSKAGAIVLTKMTARDLAPHNINVNAICPGFLWTPFWHVLSKEIRRVDPGYAKMNDREVFEARLKAVTPLKREQTPDDIGWAAVFLCSEEARNITGQSLNVDGGVYMH
ncbi:MAG TPA: glucose 1-dehydrogenase [Candidatus Sulfotelmatobacter sp.]|nr:glucose 1-dehydrogenase [Candidatus Sulfotelmatobacter sp.]